MSTNRLLTAEPALEWQVVRVYQGASPYGGSRRVISEIVSLPVEVESGVDELRDGGDHHRYCMKNLRDSFTR